MAKLDDYMEHTVKTLKEALSDEKPNAQVEIMVNDKDGNVQVVPLVDVMPIDPSPELSTTVDGDSVVLSGPLPEELEE